MINTNILIKLKLNENRIENLDKDLFKCLGCLEELDLSQNKLEMDGNEILYPLKSLKIRILKLISIKF
jgi:Leucine-rich repeat (LRR) protein